MEQVFFRIHVRFSSFIDKYFPSVVRKVLEVSSLVTALMLLGTLVTLHSAYVNSPAAATCLSAYVPPPASQLHTADIVRIHIKGWELCSAAAVHADVGQHLFCNPTALRLANYSTMLSPLGISASQIDRLLPGLFDDYSSFIGQHITTDKIHSGGVKDKMSAAIEKALSPSLTAMGECREKCQINDKGIAECTCPPHPLVQRCGIEGSGRVCASSAAHTVGDILEYNDRNIKVPSSVLFLELWDMFLFDFTSELLNLFRADKIYMYSVDKAFLMMHHSARATHNVSVLNVVIPVSSDCFGPDGSLGSDSILAVISKSLRDPIRYFIRHIVSYDVIIANWMIETFRGEGFLFNTYSKFIFDFSKVVQKSSGSQYIRVDANDSSPFSWIGVKILVLLSTVFLYVTTSTLVSFTLKETQDRMLRFTYILQYHTRNNLPVVKLVCTHLIESLIFVPIMVGMLGFLFEFFGDSLLTFLLLSVVWFCEVYTVISVRTISSVVLFPRFSFVLFCFFHFYAFSFPYGFTYLTLATVCNMIWYIMLHFWNAYEHPAILSGAINAFNVRMMYHGGMLSSMESEEDQPAGASRSPRSRTITETSEEYNSSTLAQILQDSTRNAPGKSSDARGKKYRAGGNVRLAAEPGANSVIVDSINMAFPPLPQPRRLSKSSAQEAGHEDNDHNNVGLSLDGDDEKTESVGMKHLRGLNSSGSVLDQIELSRRLQAQEMEETMNHLFLLNNRASSNALNLMNVKPTGGRTTNNAAVDDFGYREDEYRVFGAND